MQRSIVLGLAAAAAIGIVWYVLDRQGEGTAEAPLDGSPMAQVTLPELEGDEIIGARIFATKCAACHGENAAGQQGIAPPLVHKIYEPSHHGDVTFLLAARNGVRAHHWRFGSMPPVEGLNDAEIGMIVAYVRALQRANGIN